MFPDNIINDLFNHVYAPYVLMWTFGLERHTKHNVI